ncbi:MAG: glycosyltransferase family 87 protein [Hyphomicrobiales bacterium]|nr:glycosyltransferase family 87 protein [Hyphomicrobiales bacterium]
MALFVFACGMAFGFHYHVGLWTTGADGFSEVSRRLPYWDFTNLWAGSRMAIEGHVGTLFDVDAYRAELRAMFTPNLADHEWSYPPSIILFGAPLAALPILPAYLLWTFGTIAMLHFAIRPLRLPMPLHLAALASPAVFINAMFGQNGALTAALLIGGLLAAPVRPILAGVLFGLLTVKPHLGILVPFCLIASQNWRAFLSAATTAVLLAVATGLAFGFGVWPSFLTETRALMTAIMEAPYPQLYHANALTVFVMARAAGAGLGLAYAVQAVATALAIAAAIWLWLPSTPIDSRRRALATATLAIVATPYGYTYDSIPMCVALAYLFAVTSKPRPLFLAIGWLFPLFAHLLNYQGIGIGVVVPAAVAFAMMAPLLPRRQGAAGALSDTARAETGARSDRTSTVTTSS